MNRDDIMRLAKEANFDWFQYRYAGTRNALEDFAHLVVAAEREACAKVCDEEQRYWKRNEGRRNGAESCAKAIRARENA